MDVREKDERPESNAATLRWLSITRIESSMGTGLITCFQWKPSKWQVPFYYDEVAAEFIKCGNV